MGGTISSQAGGGRSIKEIKDSITAAKAKTPLDEEEMTKLTDELSAALTRKEQITTEISNLKASPSPDSAKVSELEAERIALTLGEESNVENNAKPTPPANSEAPNNGESEGTNGKGANVEGANGEGANGEGEGNNAERQKKLEKCKEKSSEEGETADIEKTQERIKEEVPSFFSFFGNWLSYDNWQSTPWEQESRECKELLEEDAKKSKNETEEGSENNAGAEGNNASSTANDTKSDAATKASTDTDATKASTDTDATKASTDTDATKAPADTDATKAPADTDATKAPADTDATKKPAESASSSGKPNNLNLTTGGRRFTHKLKRSAKPSE